MKIFSEVDWIPFDVWNWNRLCNIGGRKNPKWSSTTSNSFEANQRKFIRVFVKFVDWVGKISIWLARLMWLVLFSISEKKQEWNTSIFRLLRKKLSNPIYKPPFYQLNECPMITARSSVESCGKIKRKKDFFFDISTWKQGRTYYVRRCSTRLPTKCFYLSYCKNRFSTDCGFGKTCMKIEDRFR